MDDTSSDDLDDLLGVGDEDNKSEDEEDNGIEEDRWSDVDAPAVSDGDDEVVSSEEEVSSSIQKKLVTEGTNLEEIKVPDPSVSCLLCGQYGLEEGRLGALYRLGSLVVHHFCLMLSSGLQQVQLLLIRSSL